MAHLPDKPLALHPHSKLRVGAGGAGLTTATLSDRSGPFAEVMQAMTFERRAAA